MTNAQKAELRALVQGYTDAELSEFRDILESMADATRDPDTNISSIMIVAVEQMRREREAKLSKSDIPF